MSFILKFESYNITSKNTIGGITSKIDLNPYKELQIGSAPTASIEFNILDLSGDFPQIQTGESLEYYIDLNNLYGKYIVNSMEKINDTRYKITCFDKMYLFSKLADSWYNGLVFPISLENIFKSLCSFVGVSYIIKSALNLNFLVENNIKIENTSCKQILTHILEVMGCFAYFNSEGILIVDFYRDEDISINGDYILSTTCSDYIVTPIDKLQIKSDKNDIGVIVGTGTNCYTIENNPLFYSTTDANLRICGENLFNRLKTITYTPATVLINNSFSENILGKYIVVNTSKGSFKTLVMAMIQKGITTEIKSVGSKSRTQIQSINQAITQINGKSNKILADIERFSVTLTEIQDATEQNTAALLIEANRITQEVSHRQAGELTLNSKILQQADQISLKVSQSDFNGNTIASLINQTATTIQIQGEKIDLTGDVSISGKFSTTYNGKTVKVEDGKIKFFDGDTLTGYMQGGYKIGAYNDNGVTLNGGLTADGWISAAGYAIGGTLGYSGAVTIQTSPTRFTSLSFTRGLLTNIGYY